MPYYWSLSRKLRELESCGFIRRYVPFGYKNYLLKRFYEDNPSTAVQEVLQWMGWFLLPATAIFLAFFLLTAIVQIRAFARGHSPLPIQCWVFTVMFGLLWAVLMRAIGDLCLTNALVTGWISVGNVWMMGGLPFASKRMEADRADG